MTESGSRDLDDLDDRDDLDVLDVLDALDALADRPGFWDLVRPIGPLEAATGYVLPDGRVVSPARVDAIREAWLATGSLDAVPPDGDVVDRTLAEVVILQRLDRGLSQRALARVAGVSQSMVARFERGSREPSWRTFRMLVQAMGLEPVVDVQRAARDAET